MKKVRLKIDIELTCSEDFIKRLNSDELDEIVVNHCFKNNARHLIKAEVHKTYACKECGSTKLHWDETHDNDGFSQKIDFYQSDEAWCENCDSEQKIVEYKWKEAS